MWLDFEAKTRSIGTHLTLNVYSLMQAPLTVQFKSPNSVYGLVLFVSWEAACILWFGIVLLK